MGDAEFQRVIIRVLIIGGAIGVIAAGALVIAFRAFSAKTPQDKDFRGTILVGGVIAFVLLCCVVLLIISLR
ncbi:MAG TPA: hypothetical protein VJZ76_01790 [Thermoanaerobaculia bacterium]|nr:hypothetical protein [Thermoanaerobaculia bacterium]